MGSIINEKFAHVYVINLKSQIVDIDGVKVDVAKERRDAIDVLFKDLGIEYELFEAVNGSELGISIPHDPNKRWNAGAYGLALTTMNILSDAKVKGYPNILIFEDDVQPCDMYDLFINEALAHVPVDYDMLFLGYTLKVSGGPAVEEINGTTVYYPGFRQLLGGFSCHAYAVNSTMYDLYKGLIGKLDNPIDAYINIIMSRGKTFYANKKLFSQKNGYSFIEGKYYDTGFTK